MRDDEVRALTTSHESLVAYRISGSRISVSDLAETPRPKNSRAATVRPVYSSSTIRSRPRPASRFSRPDVITTWRPARSARSIDSTIDGSNAADSVSSTVGASVGKAGTRSTGMPIIPR